MGKKKIKQQTSESSKETSSAGFSAQVSKKIKKVQAGRVYIRASYNNTLISVTDPSGNLLTWASAGSLGFSGPKKATPFASSKIIAVVAERMRAVEMTDVEVLVRGIGSGRDSAIRSLANQGFNIVALRDITPVPHNGPRPRKVRRV